METTTFTGPGDRLTLGEQQKAFMVRHSDWRMIRKRVADIENSIPWLSALGWACVGVIPSTILSLVAWIPAYIQMPATQRENFAWVTPVMVVVGIACLVVALFCYLTNRDVDRRIRR